MIMSIKQLQSLEKKISKIKSDINKIEDMRPGSLSLQYKDRKEKTGSYYQLSYTRNMKSKTEYVSVKNVSEIKKQIANYKKFKKLTETLIDLSIEHSRLKLKLMWKVINCNEGYECYQNDLDWFVEILPVECRFVIVWIVIAVHSL